MLDAFVGYAGKRSGPAGKSTDDPVDQQICAEVTAAIDELTLVLRRWRCYGNSASKAKCRRSRSAGNTNSNRRRSRTAAPSWPRG
jgi:hypothetical protein